MNLKEKIRIIFNENITIIQNFSYLSVLQILNLVIPLVVYPYLITTLGSGVFGLVIFAQAIISYLVILVSFGFNISGAKSISVFRNDKEIVSKIFSSIFLIKTALLVLAVLALILLTYSIPSIREYSLLFFLTLWMCLYDIFFPIWYFQGIEKMKYITYISLIMKTFFLISVFFFIKAPEDYLFIPLINIAGTFISGIVAFYIIIYRHKVKIYMPLLNDLKSEFKSSIPIFVSNVSIQIYVATNKIVVGAFLGMAPVAYYDLAEKVLSLLRMPQAILSQSIFPKISKEKNIKFVKKIFKVSAIGNTLLAFLGFFLSWFIIKILAKGQFNNEAVILLKILIITVPIVGMSNVFGIQTLVAFGYNKLFSKSILISGLFYLILMFTIWTFYKFTIFNIAYVTVVTELFVTIYMFYLCKKHKIW